MRWTKGKPAEQAPCGVPVLCCYDAREFENDKPVYAVLRKTQGAWQSYGDGPPVASYSWARWPTGEMAEAPDRYWPLPGRERG